MQRVSDEQAALLAATLSNQHAEIVTKLDALARKLRFREDADESLARDIERPDVLRALRRGGQTYWFVGIARGFNAPVHDVQHHDIVRAWVRRFAHSIDKKRIAGGYVMVGAYDDLSAAVWASVLTQVARPHGLWRDGEAARFVVRKLGRFWVAC
ncbi:MAG TPA: hypothetical protein VGH87_28825 [Polyangiaceae bacterium]|jgi:hypothetical protein